MNIKKNFLPLLIILAGVVFTLYLQGLIPEGAYFSGDAGLKALLAQQLSQGEWRFDLIAPLQPWVRTLWNQGLYPYEEPYVYFVDKQYYITFPFTFPLATAPFHALFGFRGLYFIPLIAAWLIWGVFLKACTHLALNKILTSVALIGLIFASPLSLYSAMYWEHTLAVALCFSGLVVLFLPNLMNLSTGRAILSGCLIGLSVWFRPEFLSLAAILIGLILLIVLKSGKIEINKAAFLLSLVASIGCFFGLNKLIYGYFLGIHGIQAVETVSFGQKLQNAWSNFQGLSLSLVEFFPIAYFPVLFFFIFFQKRIKLTKNLVATYLSTFLFIVGVSLLVPVGTAGLIAGGKQWGPRFLLILVPVISLLAVKELSLLSANRVYRFLSIFVISLLIFLGIYKNTYIGTRYLQQTYQEVSPAVRFLRQNTNEVVAVSHQFVAQALEASVGSKKFFFKVSDGQSLLTLVSTLATQNQQRFIYICYPYRPCDLPEKIATEEPSLETDLKIQFTELGEFGKYPIYQVTWE